MAGDEDELRRWLYGGEELVESAAVESARVGVTSHRVIALTPEGEGARFREVARPNVTGVEANASGRRESALRAARAGVYAVALLAAGFLIDLGGIVGPIEAPEGVGIGGIISLVNALVGALALLDDLLLVAGLVAAAIALGALGRYLRSRERYVEVGVAGGEPIRIPASRGRGGEAAARIEAALGKG